MLFNSLEFPIFFAIFYCLYWCIKNVSFQNVLIVIASYLFYGWWDWRFLTLILFSSCVDYFSGRFLGSITSAPKRKLVLAISIVVNVSLLAVFKYYNFFIDSFNDIMLSLGVSTNINSLNIILPVGISFYTFQTMSYSIDVYRGDVKAVRNLLPFLAYVSFFPQLVAGPIERASNLLPQFEKKRFFNYQQSILGLQLILWGLFKKVVIADTCAIYVDEIFLGYNNYSSSTLLLGAFLFAFQIYGDFSGYSDIAIGLSKLIGFELMRNFNYPYFSRDIAEFWRRWHISLSTWFRDYLYIPLGGSIVGFKKRIRNTFVIFLVSGFWHGANWTFLFWGFLNALYFIPLMILNKNRKNLEIVAETSRFPSLKEFSNIVFTFSLVCLTWIFFRSASISESFEYLSNIVVNRNYLSLEELKLGNGRIELFKLILLIIGFIFVEWVGRKKLSPISFTKLPKVLKWSFYWIISALVLSYFNKEQSFIYFQF